MKIMKAKTKVHPKIQGNFITVPDKLTEQQKKALTTLTLGMEVADANTISG